jgi:ribosomal peptide maturation radical SAM protein 1
MFQQHCASLGVLRRLKELRPDLTVMLGGANCEGVMGQAAFERFPWLDAVVCGEADDVIVELVRSILSRRAADVPEGVLRRGSRPASRRAARPLVEDLDALPVPDFADYFAALESSPLRGALTPGLLLETSRGCWWGQKHHCTFCGLNGTGMAFRSKSAGRILHELKELSERHGLTRFELTDNILAMERFRDLLPGLASLDYSLFAEVKANLRREHLQALAQAGVRWIQPGLESLHDEVLKLMDKGTTTAVNLQLLKWAREFGIFVSWNFLVGFPGEEDEWYRGLAEWLPLVAHLQPPQGVFRARYDRYSPYQADPARYGLEVVPHPAYEAIYPGDVTDLAYFHLGADQQWGPALWDPTLMGPGRQALEEATRRWGEVFWSPLPAILSMDDDGRELRLLDTRPGAPVRRRSLRGAERAVYLACDVARTVRACAQEAGLTPEEARDVLAELCAARVMLGLADGRFLALAVRGELPRLLRPEEFPGGACLVAPGLEGPVPAGV